MADEVAVHHTVPPYVLISGPESLLAERALAQTLDELAESMELPVEAVSARLGGLGLEAGAGPTLTFD